MLIDLREIIDVPGGRVPFDYEPDMTEAAFGPVIDIKRPARAVGSVENCAGVLKFSARVDAVCVCVCARCLAEFEQNMQRQVSAYLNEEGEIGGNQDAYFLNGDSIDADEIIVTEFVLDLDQRLLCREDCAGLCPGCGADLNEGPCACKAEIDPRLAALGQLLE